MAHTNVMQPQVAITVVSDIATRLKEAREAAGLSQPALAKKAGVSAGTIGNIEAGHRKEPRELLAIAGAVGVSPEWLKSGRGARDPSSGGEREATPPSLADSLVVVLDAFAAVGSRSELKTLLGLIVDNDDVLYRQRLANLLGAGEAGEQNVAVNKFGRRVFKKAEAPAPASPPPAPVPDPAATGNARAPKAVAAVKRK